MRIIFLTFLIFTSSALFAHVDISFSFNKDNIHLRCETGWTDFEIPNRLNILTDLAAKLLKSKGYNTEKLYIYFNHDYTHRDASFYALGYGKFSYNNNENESITGDINTTGLKLIIRNRDFNTKQILNLINSAIANIDFIKRTQKQLLIDQRRTVNGIHQFDTLSSISSNIVKTYLLSADPTVHKLIKMKTYRNLKNEHQSWEIDYYFQDNRFHFYYTREPEEVWDQNARKYVISKTYKEEDILVVDNILEIFGDYNDGQFVFINDSTFYYIPQRNYKDRPPIKVSGPFKIDSIRAGRRPVRQYYHEYLPVERFTLFFDNYYNNKKAIFFPDSNLVISNFDKIEDDFINGLFMKRSLPDEKNKINPRFIAVLTILTLSIIINIWLLKRQRN